MRKRKYFFAFLFALVIMFTLYSRLLSFEFVEFTSIYSTLAFLAILVLATANRAKTKSPLIKYSFPFSIIFLGMGLFIIIVLIEALFTGGLNTVSIRVPRILSELILTSVWLVIPICVSMIVIKIQNKNKNNSDILNSDF